MNGYWYDYELKPAKHRVDICLATNNPKKYCNGYYKYSTKDPVIGDGPFVIIDTNDPNVKVLLIEQDMNKCWKYDQLCKYGCEGLCKDDC